MSAADEPVESGHIARVHAFIGFRKELEADKERANAAAKDVGPCGVREQGAIVRCRDSQPKTELVALDAAVGPGRVARRERFEARAVAARKEARNASSLRTVADELLDRASVFRDQAAALLVLTDPRGRKERRARRLERRATALEDRAWKSGGVGLADALERRAKWNQSRADALSRPYLERQAECETPNAAPWVTLICRAEGTIRHVPARCGLGRWCGECAKRKRGGWYKRVARGLGERHREELTRWSRAGRPKGQRPDVEMVTLTVRHTGDLEHDRGVIAKGWARMRAWLYQHDGRSMPYVLAWELTDGADGLGHVHAHVAVVWPFRDLSKLDAAWARATDGAGVNVDVSGRRKKTRGTPASSSYLASYIGKGGDCATDENLRAQWHELHANGARSWSSSRGALAPRERVPTCPTCGAYELVGQVRRELRCETVHAGPGPPFASFATA